MEDIKKMSGEQLAEILSGAFQQLQIAQQNIIAVNQELARRKEVVNNSAKEKSK